MDTPITCPPQQGQGPTWIHSDLVPLYPFTCHPHQGRGLRSIPPTYSPPSGLKHPHQVELVALPGDVVRIAWPKGVSAAESGNCHPANGCHVLR